VTTWDYNALIKSRSLLITTAHAKFSVFTNRCLVRNTSNVLCFLIYLLAAKLTYKNIDSHLNSLQPRPPTHWLSLAIPGSRWPSLVPTIQNKVKVMLRSTTSGEPHLGPKTRFMLRHFSILGAFSDERMGHHLPRSQSVALIIYT
jgi:hypothetical protein